MAYITPENITAYLDQLQVSDPETLALLEAIAERATGIVDTALGFSFEGYTAAEERTFQTRGGYRLYIDSAKPGSVTTVLSPSDVELDGNYQPVTNEAGNVYALDAITNGSFWFWEWGTPPPNCNLMSFPMQGTWPIKVTAEWGYGPPPPVIVQLTLEVAVNIWRSKDAGGFAESIGARQGGAVNITRYVAGINRDQQIIIDSVRSKYNASPPFQAFL